jgi:hypothetical protein
MEQPLRSLRQPEPKPDVDQVRMEMAAEIARRFHLPIESVYRILTKQQAA